MTDFQDETKVYKRVETKRKITLTPEQVEAILKDKVGMPNGEVIFDCGYGDTYLREVTIIETTVEEEGGLY